MHPKLAQFLLISRATTLFCFHSTFPSTLFTCLRTKATLVTSLQTFWQTWPAGVLHLIPFPSGLTGAWISICFSNDLVAEKFWTLVEHSRDRMCPRPCVSTARKLRYCQCSHHAPCASSRLGSFSLFCSQAPAFAVFLAHLVGVQESRCRETSITSFRGYTLLSSAATPLGQGGCELWVSSDVLIFASCGPAQAHGHAPASWLHVSRKSSSCAGHA